MDENRYAVDFRTLRLIHAQGLLDGAGLTLGTGLIVAATIRREWVGLAAAAVCEGFVLRSWWRRPEAWVATLRASGDRDKEDGTRLRL